MKSNDEDAEINIGTFCLIQNSVSNTGDINRFLLSLIDNEDNAGLPVFSPQ